MLWLYGQDWFLNFSVAGSNLRDMFQMHQINLSVAVWVGLIAGGNPLGEKCQRRGGIGDASVIVDGAARVDELESGQSAAIR